MSSRVKPCALTAATLLLGACALRGEPVAGASAAEPDVALSPPADVAPADAFLANLARHCGQAFAGRIVANEPPVADDPFVGQTLVMHVRACADGELRVPFHVGDDRSRTWILRRVGARLELKHDHRHADGSPDVLTFYGGTSAAPGSAQRQEFPVDRESRELFEREGLRASTENTWAMEIEAGRRFFYELRRPSGRLFQVEFDLTRPVPTPPAPWGHE